MAFTPSENPITNPTRESYTELRPFRFWCQKVLPLVYDDSLSYYELLCKVVDYLNKTMEDVDHMNTDVDTLYSSFQEFQEGTFRIYNELVDYVNTYFDELDVQEEINNKLDAMVSDGSLVAILQPDIATEVSDWLSEHITPTTPAIDNTLTVSGAGADAKVTGTIRTAVNSVNEHLDDLIKINDGFYKLNSETINNKFIRYNYTNGIIEDIASNGSSCTDFVPVYPNDKVIVRGRGQYAGIVFAVYNEKKEVVYVFPETESGSAVTTYSYVEVTIPDNGYYIRASYLSANVAGVWVKEWFNSKNAIDTIKTSLINEWNNVSFTTTQEYLARNGDVTSGSNCALTGYISVNPYEDILITANCRDSSRLVGFYDENQNLISVYPSIDNVDPQITAVNAKITVPSECYYVRVSTVYSTTIEVKKRKSIEEYIEKINKNETNINTSYEFLSDIQIYKDDNFIDISDKISGKYLLADYANNRIIEMNDSASSCTDYCKVQPGDEVLVTGRCYQSSCMYALYNNKKELVSIFPSTQQGSEALRYDHHKITIPDDCYYIRVSYISANQASVQGKSVENISDSLKTVKDQIYGNWIPLDLSNLTNAYLNRTAEVTPYANARLTDFVPVNKGEDLLITGKCRDSARLLAFYDENKNLLSVYPSLDELNPSIEAVDLRITVPTIASYIRVSAVYSTTVGIKRLYNVYDGNVLFNKSLYCMGDSFTAGDFTGYVDSEGHSGTESDAYSSGYGCYKTYPYWIAKRNSMELHNLAQVGWEVSHIVDNETYKQIPENADYAFINIGLNDVSQSTPIGNINDSTVDTFYGGLNIICSWLRANRPFLHFGIIINSAYLTNAYRTALENIAVKYGYPYLNLYDDSKVPAFMNKDGMDSTIANALYLVNQVSTTNSHPNLKSHEFQSTFIEAFIRQI